jgi:hypothetical protein
VSERKGVLLRLDPAVHDALAKWANDELRSTNAQIEFLLRRALADAGRLPRHAGPMRPRGRPPAGGRADDAAETSTPETSTPETSTPETSTPETSTPETSTPETSSPAQR